MNMSVYHSRHHNLVLGLNDNLGILAFHIARLANLSNLVAKSQNRISTGYKVSKASDAPADYVIAQMMSRNRTEMGNA